MRARKNNQNYVIVHKPAEWSKKKIANRLPIYKIDESNDRYVVMNNKEEASFFLKEAR